MKVILYSRVSTEGQRDNTSIDTQLERGKAYIISQGWQLESTFIDEAESGKNDQRPAFQEMLSYINEHDIKGIVVFKADRLFRSLRHLLSFIEDTLDPKNISLISVTEAFNSGSSEGRLFLQMLGSFAEFERKRINERTFEGKVSTAKKGKWNGGHVPFGYTRIEGSEYDFDIDPDTAPLVKQIFKLYAQGYGYSKIKKLTGCSLSHQGISNLISNPFYYGKIQFSGILKDNNHAPIISKRLFTKCQNIRKEKALR